MKLTKEGIAIIDGDTYLSQDIINQGRLDVAKDFLEQFRQYIPVGGVVVDVGACLGDYTATFSEMVGPNGRVIAFEPNPPVMECLRHNLEKYANVVFRSCGLGAEFSGANVEVDSNNVGASRLVPITLTEGSAETAVVVRAMDEISYDLDCLDFLKIDAEGWEPLILDGGKETINRFRPVILIEVNTWPLGKMGFTAEDVFSRLDTLNYSFPRFDGPYGDILCLPKEHA